MSISTPHRAPADWAEDTDTLDPDFLRLVFGRFPTGVTIVTTRAADHRPVGVTVNSFNTVSLEPPLVLWSLTSSSVSLPAFKERGRFAISILADHQRDIAIRFASPVEDKFRDMPTLTGLGDIPLIDGAVAHLECRIESLIPAGDHTILLGRIERAGQRDGTPLVFHCGRFEGLAGPSA